MAEIVMHESAAHYAEWVHGECLRLEKENGILRGLLFKARIELKKHDPQCAEMLKELTPNYGDNSAAPQAQSGAKRES